MGFFAEQETKISSQDVAGGSGRWILPGQHVMQVQKCTLTPSQKNKSEILFIAELVCLTTTSQDETYIDESGTEKIRKAMQPNAVYSTVMNLSKQMGPVNVKKFVCACYGVDAAAADAVERVCEIFSEPFEDDYDFEEICDFAYSEDQPLEGILLDCDAVLTKTKAGHPFTKLNWRLHEVEDGEEE